MKNYTFLAFAFLLLGSDFKTTKYSIYSVDIMLSRTETTIYGAETHKGKISWETEMNLHSDAALVSVNEGNFRCEVIPDDEDYKKEGGLPFTGKASIRYSVGLNDYIMCDNRLSLSKTESGSIQFEQDVRKMGFLFDYYGKTHESNMSTSIEGTENDHTINGKTNIHQVDCQGHKNDYDNSEVSGGIASVMAATVLAHAYMSEPFGNTTQSIDNTLSSPPQAVQEQQMDAEQTAAMEEQMKKYMSAEQFAQYKTAMADAARQQQAAMQQAGQETHEPTNDSNDSPEETPPSAAEMMAKMGWGGKMNTSPTSDGGYIITYSFENAVKNEEEHAVTTYKTTMQTKIYRKKKAELKALIVPLTEKWEVYEKWIPQGEIIPIKENPTAQEISNPNYGRGDSIAFKVILVKADDMSQNVSYLHDFHVIYQLKDVSKHKGICNNYPQENANSDPDLRFDTLDIQFDEGKYESAKTFKVITAPRSGADAAVNIVSYDFAAFGKLTAEVVVEDLGITLQAEYEKKPGQTFLKIPIDNNENKIADAWEKDLDVFNQKYPANTDIDLYPKDQRCSGDGYTLWEEYRGFVAKEHKLASETNGNRESKGKGSHFRTDPNHKDCFVIDDNGCFKQYYENDAWLNWHYIGSKNVKKLYRSRIDGDVTNENNRWVNFNSDIYDESLFYARQYTVLIMTSDKITPGGGTVGGAEKGSSDGNNMDFANKYFDSPVHAHYRILLYPEQAKEMLKARAHYQQASPEGKTFMIKNDLKNTVNHEIGHNLGIMHHRFLQNRDNKFYDSFENGEVGEAQSGAACCMRYYTGDQIEAGVLDTPLPIKYCRKGEFGIKFSRTGRIEDQNYPSDNCFGNIKVKSDKE